MVPFSSSKAVLSSIVILILFCESIRGQEIRRCYWCGPLAEQVHRSRRAPPCGANAPANRNHITDCEPGHTHCAVVATAPPHIESRYCVKLYQDECYPLFCNSTKTWKMTCPCRGDLCNGPNTEREVEAFAVLSRLIAKTHNSRIKKRTVPSSQFIIKSKNSNVLISNATIETQSNISQVAIDDEYTDKDHDIQSDQPEESIENYNKSDNSLTTTTESDSLGIQANQTIDEHKENNGSDVPLIVYYNNDHNIESNQTDHEHVLNHNNGEHVDTKNSTYMVKKNTAINSTNSERFIRKGIQNNNGSNNDIDTNDDDMQSDQYVDISNDISTQSTIQTNNFNQINNENKIETSIAVAMEMTVDNISHEKTTLQIQITSTENPKDVKVIETKRKLPLEALQSNTSIAIVNDKIKQLADESTFVEVTTERQEVNEPRRNNAKPNSINILMHLVSIMLFYNKINNTF